MTVTVNKSHGDDYKWSSGYTWNSAEGGKKWSEANTSIFDMSVSEQIDILERALKSIEIPIPMEQFGISGGVNALDVGKGVNESIAINESFNTVNQFARSFVTAIFLLENLSKSSEIGFDESVGLIDSNGNQVNFSRGFMESIGFTEMYADGISFVLALQEQLSVSDSNVNVVQFIRKLAESVSIDEHIRRDMSIPKAESFSVVDSYKDQISFILKMSETIFVLEDERKSIGANREESLRVVDKTAKDVAKDVFEFVTVSSSYKDLVSFYLNALSGFGIQDEIAKGVGLNHYDDISIDERNGFDTLKAVAESMAIMDVFSKLAVFLRGISEELSIEESIAKASSMSFSEQISAYDQIVRNHDAVLSDLIVNDNIITESDFRRLIERSAPVGYEEFSSFVTGDYEYLEALFKIAFHSKTSDLAAVNNVKIEVDLPDVYDSGQMSIPASATRVNFNRSFNTIPEVSVVLKGGTVIATPDFDVDMTGFTVTLRQADGTAVAGVISWNAHGY